MSIDWSIVLATLAGPVLAVQAQKWIERASDNRRRRREIFHTLMTNRATRLSDPYIQALNRIDFEFGQKGWRNGRDKAVINSWRALFGELSHAPAIDDATANAAWNRSCEDRLVDLLSAMSASLGYSYSPEELRRGIYYPKGRVELEQHRFAILQGLRAIMDGKVSLPMRVTEAPASPEAAELQKRLTQRMVSAYDEDGALKVRMQPERAKPRQKVTVRTIGDE
jgi:hypothetical protein